jgi:RNA polymerase sigma factor (sigma-70 family)
VPNPTPDRSSSAERRVSVFTAYTPELHRFLRQRFARTGAELQDLMQEIAAAFLAVPREIVIQDPVKYLFGIARHVGCRHLERRAHDPLDCCADVTPESLLQGSVDAAELDAVSHDLLKQVSRLPGIYQEVLKLQMESGLSIREIARRLNLSQDTVKKYLSKAKAQLRMGGP